MKAGRLARLLLIPSLAGLLLALVAYAAVGGTKAAPAAAPMTFVVFVQENIPARTAIQEGQLSLRRVPVDLAGGAATALAEASGRMAEVPLVAGEILLRSKLVALDRAALSFRIPEGHRAVTFQVDEFSGVADHMAPGDKVDVAVVFPEKPGPLPNTKLAALSRIVLQDILVLEKGLRKGAGLADQAQAPAAGKAVTSVTLALTPEDAVQVTLAERIGELKFMLRPAVGNAGASRPSIEENALRQGGR